MVVTCCCDLHNMFGAPQHQMNMYKCLSAVMHMGNVDFSENDAEQSSVRNKQQLQVVVVSATVSAQVRPALTLPHVCEVVPFFCVPIFGDL